MTFYFAYFLSFAFIAIKSSWKVEREALRVDIWYWGWQHGWRVNTWVSWVFQFPSAAVTNTMAKNNTREEKVYLGLYTVHHRGKSRWKLEQNLEGRLVWHPTQHYLQPRNSLTAKKYSGTRGGRLLYSWPLGLHAASPFISFRTTCLGLVLLTVGLGPPSSIKDQANLMQMCPWTNMIYILSRGTLGCAKLTVES